MSETITQKEVRHIAMLSRLKLSDDEVRALARELTAILDYVNQLKEVDIEGVEPTAHAVAVNNVFRADEVRPSFDPDTALANAPDRESSFFKVPKVLDRDTV